MFFAKPLRARSTGAGENILRLAIGLVVLSIVAGCGKHDETATTTPTETGAPGNPAAAPPATAVSAQVAAMGVDQLRAAASSAVREQRLYAPAGNNAMEYYLALRDKAPNDAAIASALTDLLPYALIATEQSITREDFSEAQRLYALMEKTDPKAPALPRLKQSIADGQAASAKRTADAATKTEEDTKRQADLEKQRLADQQKTQQAAAQQLAAQKAADDQAATQQRAADERAAAQRATAQRPTAPAPTQQAAATPSAPAAQPAAAAASTELRAISTPAPKYPAEAYRSGTQGEVQVEFTVGTDGSVNNARVIHATPPRVFDREALAAVKRWRFQPVPAPVTSRRTIGFNPGG